MPLQHNDIHAVADRATAYWPALDADRLVSYLSEIASWNDQIGLVSKKSTGEVLDRLVRVSIDMWRLISNHRDLARGRVVDIGTGGGFPGMIWKLGAPEIDLTLVERRERKAAFLTRVVLVLNLFGVRVVARDATELHETTAFGEYFDAGTTLAVGAPTETAPLVAPLLRQDGLYCTVVPTGTTPPSHAGVVELVATEPSVSGTLCLFRNPAP